MHTMLLLLGIMYEMVVQDQSHVRLMEEDNQKCHCEELNEQQLHVFEEDCLMDSLPRRSRS
jgi:hypothetical protein